MTKYENNAFKLILYAFIVKLLLIFQSILTVIRNIYLKMYLPMEFPQQKTVS